MSITLANRQRTRRLDPRRLHPLVTALLAELHLDPAQAELGITFVSAGRMAQVNWDFLQHEGSTDVITFDHSAESMEPHCPPLPLHGELFVCVDDAVKQAREFRTTWQSEVVRYIVHGVLHLLGHDDLSPAPRRRMKREENRLVRRLGAQFNLAAVGRSAAKKKRAGKG